VNYVKYDEARLDT